MEQMQPYYELIRDYTIEAYARGTRLIHKENSQAISSFKQHLKIHTQSLTCTENYTNGFTSCVDILKRVPELNSGTIQTQNLELLDLCFHQLIVHPKNWRVQTEVITNPLQENPDFNNAIFAKLEKAKPKPWENFIL